MPCSKTFLVLTLTAIVLGAGGCGVTEPFIYKDDEYNRSVAGFGSELKDRNSVEICYNKRSTTPDVVGKMANAECAKFGKTARFQSHDFLECPLITPARAIFSCVEG